jgi:uncharacterized damage-inducible protein DinB
MNRRDYFLQVFAYEKWANQLMIEKLLSLPELPARAHEVFAHILSAQQIWLNRLKEEAVTAAIWENYQTDEWEHIEMRNMQQYEIYINGLAEADFDKLILYHNSKGEEFKTPVNQILTHVSHHSAYHRGQLVLLIKPWTKELPQTDYIIYSRLD